MASTFSLDGDRFAVTIIVLSFCSTKEKHIRRPYLAFDDVLGDALEVKCL